MSFGTAIVVVVSLALYRRYRPETYAEVIGQEHVTDPLQQALRNNRVNHAYLFSGPRGCGKTTSARILARCLNCEQGPTPTPCGACRSCVDLARGGPGSIDVIEIDAASHGGVDDARDLREKAFFAPVNSRYKIYIIDEAHMVTSAGFNALLKVVEEPPEHLKFIFATTEPEKVIGTIRSRTHHYPFRLVPPGVLRDYLEKVCGDEGVSVEKPVFPLVVQAGAGSVRDSMSVMDQLLAGADEHGVTYAMATSLLGFTDRALLDDVADAFAARDGAAAFQVIDRVIEGGFDPRRFVADLLVRLRDLVILAAVPDAADKGLIDVPGDQLERMAAQARAFGQAELTRAADIVNTGLTEMRGATSPRLQLELICARVLLPGAGADEQSLGARLDRLERRADLGVTGGMPGPGPSAGPGPGFGGDVRGGHEAEYARPPAPGGGGGTPAVPPQGPSQSASPGPPQGPPPVPPAAPPHQAPDPTAGSGRAPGAWPTASRPHEQQPQQQPQQQSPQQPPQQSAPPPAQASGGGGDVTRVRGMWPQIIEAVSRRRKVTWVLLQRANVAGFDGTTLQVSFEHAGARDGFVNSGHDEVLRQSVLDAFGVDWRIECIVDPGTGGGPAPGGPGGSGGGGRAYPPPANPAGPGQGGAGQAPGAWPSTSRPPQQNPQQQPEQHQQQPQQQQQHQQHQAPQQWQPPARQAQAPQRDEPQAARPQAVRAVARPAPTAAATAGPPPEAPYPQEPPPDDAYAGPYDIDDYGPGPADYAPAPVDTPPAARPSYATSPDDENGGADARLGGMSGQELLARELGATVIEESAGP
ncbi:DNA polymerase III subunit gamma and tau [Yinghuangia sp. ASG 101]|uniref:DNA polymerase III subunit gamma and tau n=1 Tax=Yinghuangia sp. ASG 101 TaxID=2896848 RepID=UPI001E52742F|nr:DNA polymerase III subunit gamma and tau [Yinghuangia sp. ASG 101]UGQ09053.1 DNA polymerase III subunit gamma and tau [Yinghuangia sp. ASG 101]